MKNRGWSIIGLLLISAVLSAETVMCNNAGVRSGAGPFYPVIATLNSGDAVTVISKEEDPWYEVRLKDNRSGFVAANVFEKSDKVINFEQIAAAGIADKSVDKLIVSAAVKGFFANSMKSDKLNQQVMNKPFQRFVTATDYDRFKDATFPKGRWSHKKYLRKSKLNYMKAYYLDESLIGTSIYIAARFSGPGLSSDISLVKYVNEVAQLVYESTEYPNMPVTVYVVKTDDIFANATPAGLIVISEGMLKMVGGENELACLIGHEIAHVTLGHGIQETKHRAPKIRGESAFKDADQELDAFEEEMGKKDDWGHEEEMADLEAIAYEMFERSIKGRTEEYEGAADIRGVQYAMRAGYDPRGMVNLMKRLEPKMKGSNDDTKASHWFPPTFKNRIAALDTYYQDELRYNEKNYMQFTDRYRQYVRW